MNIKCCLLTIAMLGLKFYLNAQYFEPKLNEQDPNLPEWVKLMYSEDPNVYEVDRAFADFYKSKGKPFKHDIYSRYYKRWRRFVTPYIEDNGHIHYPSTEERLAASSQQNHAMSRSAGDWEFLGPRIHYNAKYNTGSQYVPISRQANVYCVDRCDSDPDVMYCGTESGGVYKTTDKAQNWFYVTRGLSVEGINAIGVDPSNPDVCLFGAANEIWRTTNGGETWQIAGDQSFQNLNIKIWQFHFNPQNPAIIFAATDLGLYRSIDNGINWTQIFSGECMSVELKPNDPTTVYALRYNSVTQIADFYKSTDNGLTFSIRPNGWFTVPAEDAGKITNRGGRIAITEANPNRVYVLLVGTSQSDAVLQLRGTIGVYNSADSGENWTFPHQLIGMPYDQDTHPNLMDFDGESSTYNQIYYNTAFAASHLNENRLLIGGLNLWRSEDGGATYSSVGGYIGGLPLMHVDLQEFRNYKTSATTEEFWFSSDGGLNLSEDWCQTHVALIDGIGAVNFWGIDQGWNDDILAGGRYHNGNGAYFDTYGPGSFLALGGGENATGYVNYSPERKAYFSDIGGRIIPVQQDDIVSTFSTSQYPNESYYDNNSSRIMFDWEYWNIAYMGKDNKLNISTSGGSSFTQLYDFGSSISRVLWIEQSHANPAVFYVQALDTGNNSRLYKSTDGGNSFIQLTLPQTKRELYFSTSYTNEDELWIAYTGGSNGNKVYRSSNGGQSWVNITTGMLDGYSVKAIAHQAGTNSGVYVAMRRGPVLYRNASMSDWVTVGENVPAASYPLRLMPFYPKNKLRLGMWNIGVWQHDLEEPSALIADFSSNFSVFSCPGDTIWFVNHSVCDSSATLQWFFESGNPATSNERAPKVSFTSSGVFEVTLIVTQNGISDTISKTAFISSLPEVPFPLSEDFESQLIPEGWKHFDAGNDGDIWEVNSDQSAFGTGSGCVYFDNYNINVEGLRDRIQTRPIEGLSSNQQFRVMFDVAYARYASNYSDSLAVYVSDDCGETLEQLYYKGGVELSTAPDYTAGIFVPDNAEWRTDTILVESLPPNSSFVISFENRGHWGQAIYLDNIRMEQTGIITSLKTTQTALDVYPIPAGDLIQVSSKGFKTELKNFEVFDSSGRICISGRVNSDQFEIDTSKLSSGVYLLLVSNGEQVSRMKFSRK
ncbi:MAG: T9SS type A sorting domain-containing protein [Bacteroidetes bacterium]|nr:T9SS type A sorting domain-containing protein [Bacteroidota bacterium]